MAEATVNGVRLYFELTGSGSVPLVLVHGSWSSHETWGQVVPGLAASCRVLTFDRRGHSRSERLPGRGSVTEDVSDVAALLEHLDLAPAWVAGSSFGASIVLRLAATRPDLFRGLIAHEPPLFSLIEADTLLSPLVLDVVGRVRAVIERIASGDHSGAAEQFVDTVAIGPGAWSTLPAPLRQTFIDNAPTYLDEGRDPEQLLFDLDAVRTFAEPTLLTKGEQSPPIFPGTLARLAEAMPTAEVQTFAGAGHIPYNTHADDYVRVLSEFIGRHTA